jgi:hypothetical protein
MYILQIKNNYLLVFPLNTRFQARLNAYGIFTPEQVIRLIGFQAATARKPTVAL